MGIIIGSILGYKFGGWLGMIFGAWIGHSIEQRITGPSTASNKKQIQESYFTALFLTMGKMAKIDGKVSTVEIERAEGIMKHMNLNQEMRQKAISLFNQGKRSSFSIDSALLQFGKFARRSLSLKQIFLEMLLDVAEADGQLTLEEQKLIEHTCQLIGYPIQLLYAMMKMRGFYSSTGQQQSYQQHNQRNKSQHRNQQPNRNAPFNPYQVLGVSQNDSKASIRKAYKRLMSQHHPDKLVSKGLPPEMMKLAEEKAKQVQLAWERVKELKGW